MLASPIQLSFVSSEQASERESFSPCCLLANLHLPVPLPPWPCKGMLPWSHLGNDQAAGTERRSGGCILKEYKVVRGGGTATTSMYMIWHLHPISTLLLLQGSRTLEERQGKSWKKKGAAERCKGKGWQPTVRRGKQRKVKGCVNRIDGWKRWGGRSRDYSVVRAELTESRAYNMAGSRLYALHCCPLLKTKNCPLRDKQGIWLPERSGGKSGASLSPRKRLQFSGCRRKGLRAAATTQRGFANSPHMHTSHSSFHQVARGLGGGGAEDACVSVVGENESFQSDRMLE